MRDITTGFALILFLGTEYCVCEFSRLLVFQNIEKTSDDKFAVVIFFFPRDEMNRGMEPADRGRKSTVKLRLITRQRGSALQR